MLYKFSLSGQENIPSTNELSSVTEDPIVYDSKESKQRCPCPTCLSFHRYKKKTKPRKSCSHYYADIWKHAKTLSEMQILGNFIRGECLK